MHIEIPSFRPHPLVWGGHAQTLMAWLMPGTKTSCYGAQQHRVTLDDGDQIVLHDDRGSWQPGEPVALMVHGLGGTHLSPYMVRGSEKLLAAGLRVFRMDLRGWGAGFGLNRQPLHAGRSDDARAALEFIARLCPGSPIHLVGFSMGANMSLKLAGEMGAHPLPSLASVMAVSPPICLVTCCKRMGQGFNRVYDRNFIRWLQRYHQRRKTLFPEETVPAAFPGALLEYDAQVTAPQCGFASAHDYYEQSSAMPRLSKITLPTLIVAAADDPIIPIHSFEQASFSPTTQVEITPSGGHLGFIGRGGIDADRRWIDWRVVDWVLHHGRRREWQATIKPHAAPPSRGRSAAMQPR